MFCTTCEIVALDFVHYKSQLHALNMRRKKDGYPPLQQEELEGDSRTDDFSIDLNHNITEKPVSVSTTNKKSSKHKACLLCEHKESPEHYMEHGFDREQITYILKMQCYVCYEKFISSKQLFEHLEGNMHRTGFTDGSTLYLETGVRLLPTNRALGTSFAVPKTTTKKNQKNGYFGQLEEQEKINIIKCNMFNNYSYKNKPHAK
ncbi:hypothetical protein ENBRE01_1236 [Enteropsectra breve]|nr:hypothetical protein ENBRE01_1236 [Enteropsectra breve]